MNRFRGNEVHIAIFAGFSCRHGCRRGIFRGLATAERETILGQIAEVLVLCQR